MTLGELAARAALTEEKKGDPVRRQVEKWLACQTENSAPRNVQWNEWGIWFDTWNVKAKGWSMGIVKWDAVQAAIVDHERNKKQKPTMSYSAIRRAIR